MRVFPSTGFFCFNLARGFEYGGIRIPGTLLSFLGMGLGSSDLLFCFSGFGFWFFFSAFLSCH